LPQNPDVKPIGGTVGLHNDECKENKLSTVLEFNNYNFNL